MNKMKCEKCNKVYNQKNWLYCPFCGSELIDYIEQTKSRKGILISLERAYPEHLILVHGGMFYNAWHESAIALSLMFEYKLNKSTKNGYVSTGFPVFALESMVEKISIFNVNYVIEKNNEIIYEFHNGNSLSEFIHNIKK